MELYISFIKDATFVSFSYLGGIVYEKITIATLGGKSLSKYKEALESKGIDFYEHPNPERPLYQQLINVEINTIEELFAIFEDFEGFSYPDCQIAIKCKE